MNMNKKKIFCIFSFLLSRKKLYCKENRERERERERERKRKREKVDNVVFKN